MRDYQDSCARRIDNIGATSASSLSHPLLIEITFSPSVKFALLQRLDIQQRKHAVSSCVDI